MKIANLLLILFIFPFAVVSGQDTNFVLIERETINLDPDSYSLDSIIPFVVVEEKPKFNNSDSTNLDGLLKYIVTNYKYPNEWDDVLGRIFVSFVIEKDGSVSNVKLLRELEGFDEYNKEAIRVVKSMPKWTPAKHKGVPVRTSFMVPIRIHP